MADQAAADGQIDQYARMGAVGDESGLYVRFMPGFGLNVALGRRAAVHTQLSGRTPDHYADTEEIVMSIQGWDRLGEFVDEWRAREEAQRG